MNGMRKIGLLFALSAILVMGSGTVAFAGLSGDVQKNAGIGKIQIPFVENQGQVHEDVAFYARTFGGTVFVTKESQIVLVLPSTKDGDLRSLVIREEFAGSSISKPSGLEESVSRINSFIGDDPGKWSRDIKSYNKVSLGTLYDGIVLELKATGQTVEKIFTVQPGADPDRILIRSQGITDLKVSKSGELKLTTPLGTIIYSKPVAWQVVDGKKSPVEVAYNILENGYGFRIGDYDGSEELLIDPLLNATYLGGSLGNDRAQGVVVDPSSGDIYVAGYTLSSDFPNVSAGWDSTRNNQDAFVARFDSTLTNLEVATFLGGTGAEQISDYGGPVLGVNPDSGDVYIAGISSSSDFPEALNFKSGTTTFDAFLARMNGDLTNVLSARYFGGSRNDYGTALAIDPDTGAVLLAGYTLSYALPGTTGNFQENNSEPAGNWEGFIASFPSDLNTVNGATFLGGTGSDVVSGIAIYPSSSAYGTTEVCITGIAAGSDFAVAITASVISDSADATPGGLGDAFAACFDLSLDDIERFTFIGGSEGDTGHTITVDSESGDCYVVGATASSTDMPFTTAMAQPAFGGGLQDAFVARIDGADFGQLWVTYLGGSDNDYATAIDLDPAIGAVFVTGVTSSDNFPMTTGGDVDFYSGNGDGFVSRLNLALTSHVQSTYFGGTMQEWSYGLDVSPVNGGVYITGITNSTSLPGVTGGYQDALAGQQDAFAAYYDTTLEAPAGCSDGDDDGYSPEGGGCGPVDCDDGDDTIYPGASEVCDNKDNDCDAGTLDGSEDPLLGQSCDGPDSDLCEEGTNSCIGGAIVCSDTSLDNLDLCNGSTDDDCNAATPDGSDETWFGTSCDGADSDLCLEGTYSCVSGSQSCSDTSSDDLDLCNGVDDDCDAASADGSEDTSVGQSCDGPDSDLCEEGTTSCTGGAIVCSDTSSDNLDVCNGVDDDCDAASVDGSEDPSVGLACDGADADLCEEGTNSCTGGAIVCSDTTGDNVEICNGLDDDCDGSTDEGFPLYTYFEDLDGDTFGNAAATTETCLASPVSPYVADSTDCDDSDEEINPSDADFDGYSTCDDPPDCDDSDAVLNLDDPGIGELVGDGYSTCTGDTETGSDIEVYADDPTSLLHVEVNFATINTSGLTAVAATTTVPAVPSGWQVGDPPLFFDLTTTAAYGGTITVCVEYDESSFIDESKARIYHYDVSDWVDVTLSGYPDTASNTLCGEVTHLSVFAALEEIPPPPSGGGGGGGGCNLSNPDQESGIGPVAILLLFAYGLCLWRRKRQN